MPLSAQWVMIELFAAQDMPCQLLSGTQDVAWSS